jgi:membrane fusion protein, multidrug efflux system
MHLSLPKTFLLLFAVAACSRPATTEESDGSTSKDAYGEETVTTEKAKLVRAIEVASGTASNVLEATANVESLDIVDVMPEKTEPVVELFVEEGDDVKAGQLLAKLRNSQSQLAVNEALVKVSEAQISLVQAQREYDRDSRLVNTEGGASVLSQRDLETRMQTLETSKTTLQAAEFALDTAELGLKQCDIVSPINGTVTLRDISMGDMASPSARAFQVIDLSAPRVMLNRPQRELRSLRVGQKLSATSEALPGVVINGEIERISPAINLETGTVKVTAKLNPSAQLPNGILVRIDLILDSHANATMLDKRALVNEGDYSYAFVIRDEHAFKVEVFQGFTNELSVEIDERTAINKGEFVVIVGADRLKDGDLVSVVTE